MESGVVDEQKAEAEAQKIGTTAVPDAQGNVQPVRFEPITDTTAPSAAEKGLQAAAPATDDSAGPPAGSILDTLDVVDSAVDSPTLGTAPVVLYTLFYYLLVNIC